MHTVLYLHVDKSTCTCGRHKMIHVSLYMNWCTFEMIIWTIFQHQFTGITVIIIVYCIHVFYARFFFHKRLLDLPNNFPNDAIREAYISPSVDRSTDAFEWGQPDLDLLRQ